MLIPLFSYENLSIYQLPIYIEIFSKKAMLIDDYTF